MSRTGAPSTTMPWTSQAGGGQPAGMRWNAMRYGPSFSVERMADHSEGRYPIPRSWLTVGDQVSSPVSEEGVTTIPPFSMGCPCWIVFRCS